MRVTIAARIGIVHVNDVIRARTAVTTVTTAAVPPTIVAM
jgi:hypothetical protein